MMFSVAGAPTLPLRVLIAHAFVDGGYLRKEGEKFGASYPNPKSTVEYVVQAVRDMGGYSPTVPSVLCRRTSFYDGVPSSETGQAVSVSPSVEAYWNFVEGLNDTDLRFSEARGRPMRQKGVDVLLAVDMLVGALNDVFQVAVLIAGDLDFLPVVNEVRRRGVSVVVSAGGSSVSKELRAAADRFVPLDGAGSWALVRDAFVPPTNAPTV